MKKITLIILPFFFTVLATCKKEKVSILIDGSSTVYPISQAMAEEFMRNNPDANITVAISGTGGGFKKFCNNETDISNASREIKLIEIEKCKEKNVEFIEIPVGYDALSIVVSKENNFIDNLTVEEVKKIFQAENPAKRWKDIRPNWPDKEIKVHSPGQDSGTYDYFVEATLGKDTKVRSDASFSEDDNVLVVGISKDPYAIGYFGIAYLEENKDKIKGIPIQNPKTKKFVPPEVNEVFNQNYVPYSRPLFIYIKKASLNDLKKGKVLNDFINFYLSNPDLINQVGYIAFKNEEYEILKKHFSLGRTGSPKNEKHAGEFFSIQEVYGQ